jgi:hypothetical protein
LGDKKWVHKRRPEASRISQDLQGQMIPFGHTKHIILPLMVPKEGKPNIST